VTLVPHELPEYVELGGRQVWRPPYTARHAEVFGFVVQADRAVVDSLLQEALVEPTRGAVDYRCANDFVMVTFTRIEELASGDPLDQQRGFMEEHEVALWCLAADVTAARGRLVWYLPYVFTDTGQTVATGREVYGYPKQIGLFDANYPDNLLNGGETTVQALAIDPFGPNKKAELRPMVSALRDPTVRRRAEPITSDRRDFSIHDEFTAAFPGGLQVERGRPRVIAPRPSAVITAVDAPSPPRSTPPRPWIRRMAGALERIATTLEPEELIIDMIANPKLVFLKQFRDVACETKACYQAVVEAPLRVHPIGATYQPLDADTFELSLADYASHPIASDLGIPRGPVRPVRAFRATLDFDIQLGHEVWRAPT
jgi:hypothetical protein